MLGIMAKSDYIVLDVETTGFKPHEGHSIIEVAGERIRDLEVVNSYHSLVMTDRHIDEESQSIHGISNELLTKEGKPAEMVIPEFVQFIEDLPLIGHNIGFDLAFLNAHLDRLGQPSLKNKTIDTIELARKYLIIPSYSLEKVAAYLKVPQPSAHRAQVDVEVTRQVFIKLNERAQARGRAIDIAKDNGASSGPINKKPAAPSTPSTQKLF